MPSTGALLVGTKWPTVILTRVLSAAGSVSGGARTRLPTDDELHAESGDHPAAPVPRAGGPPPAPLPGGARREVRLPGTSNSRAGRHVGRVC